MTHIIILRNGETLTGQVTTREFSIKTSYAELTFKKFETSTSILRTHRNSPGRMLLPASDVLGVVSPAGHDQAGSPDRRVAERINTYGDVSTACSKNPFQVSGFRFRLKTRRVCRCGELSPLPRSYARITPLSVLPVDAIADKGWLQCARWSSAKLRGDRDLSIFAFSASSGVAPCSLPLKRLKLSFPWLSVESGISPYVLFLALA